MKRYLPPPPVPEVNRAAYGELACLAVNLNQIAHAANTGRVNVDAKLLREILHAVAVLHKACLALAPRGNHDRQMYKTMAWFSREASLARPIHGMPCNNEDCTMSKMDTIKGMTEARNTLSQDLQDNDQARLEAQLMVLSMQEEARIRNSQELIKLLMKLNNSISQATSSVQEAAREVRATQANVIGQFSEQMRQCLSACEAASNRTREDYEKTAKFLAVLDDGQIKVNILVGVLSTFVCALVMVALPRVVAWLSN